VRRILADARRGHIGLYALAVGMAGLAVVIAVLAVFDQRVLLGAPLWFKPLKFAISFAAYAGVLAWMFGQLPRPALRRSGWVIVAASVIEVAIIAGQAARGEMSHFNQDGGLGSLLFSIMGATIVALYLATVAIAVRFLREPSLDRDMAVAVRLGLLVALVGMAVGVIMIIDNGHAVSVPDGGPGLPLLGWSTTGGDLRIGHFVGMHALQVLPLVAAGLARYVPRLDVPARVRAVTVVGTGLLGLVALLVWQALRAQPLLAPDLGTAAVLAALVLGTGVGLLAALRPTGRRSAAAESGA
jgi:hypothetical protein